LQERLSEETVLSNQGQNNKVDGSLFECLLALDDAFKEWTVAGALTPELRLVLLVLSRGSVTIKEAMYDCRLSYRAFYMMVDRLKAKELIVVKGGEQDGRVRRISLHPSATDAPITKARALFAQATSPADQAQWSASPHITQADCRDAM